MLHREIRGEARNHDRKPLWVHRLLMERCVMRLSLDNYRAKSDLEQAPGDEKMLFEATLFAQTW